jgi:hypothetical protein
MPRSLVVPQGDGRPEFSAAIVAMANASLGRMPFAGVEQRGPDRYVIANAWPAPKPSPAPSSSGGMSSGVSPPVVTPKSPGQALWPNLPSRGG